MGGFLARRRRLTGDFVDAWPDLLHDGRIFFMRPEKMREDVPFSVKPTFKRK